MEYLLGFLAFYITFCALVACKAQRKMFYARPKGLDENRYWQGMYEKYAEGVMEECAALRGRMEKAALVNASGHRVTAYYVAASRPSRGIVVLLHGYNGCALQMLPYALPWVHAGGYDLLIPNWEHHADSEGSVITMGYHERRDLKRWMDEASRLLPDSPQRFILHGVSMGAATAMLCSGDPRVVGVVDDCGYCSTRHMSRFTFRKKKMPVWPTLPLLNLVTRLREGFWLFSVCPERMIAESTAPLLCIHGTADTTVPYSSMARLMDAKRQGWKRSWTLPDVGHAMAMSTQPAAYEQHLQEFMRQLE